MPLRKYFLRLPLHWRTVGYMKREKWHRLTVLDVFSILNSQSKFFFAQKTPIFAIVNFVLYFIYYFTTSPFKGGHQNTFLFIYVYPLHLFSVILFHSRIFIHILYCMNILNIFYFCEYVE